VAADCKTFPVYGEAVFLGDERTYWCTLGDVPRGEWSVAIVALGTLLGEVYFVGV
jgi:hypothetical protein